MEKDGLSPTDRLSETLQATPEIEMGSKTSFQNVLLAMFAATGYSTSHSPP